VIEGWGGVLGQQQGWVVGPFHHFCGIPHCSMLYADLRAVPAHTTLAAAAAAAALWWFVMLCW
jgi:hypothetical protein